MSMAMHGQKGARFEQNKIYRQFGKRLFSAFRVLFSAFRFGKRYKALYAALSKRYKALSPVCRLPREKREPCCRIPSSHSFDKGGLICSRRRTWTSLRFIVLFFVFYRIIGVYSSLYSIVLVCLICFDFICLALLSSFLALSG